MEHYRTLNLTLVSAKNIDKFYWSKDDAFAEITIFDDVGKTLWKKETPAFASTSPTFGFGTMTVMLDDRLLNKDQEQGKCLSLEIKILIYEKRLMIGAVNVPLKELLYFSGGANRTELVSRKLLGLFHQSTGAELTFSYNFSDKFVGVLSTLIPNKKQEEQRRIGLRRRKNVVAGGIC